MFIISIKLKMKKLMAGLLFCIVIIFALAITMKSYNSGVFFVQDEQMVYTFDNIRSNDNRVDFLKQFGWDVDEKPLEIMQIQIPNEFDAVYNRYNEIQKEIGLDLLKHRGKKVKRYTYTVNNYPNANKGIRANLLVYNNKVIAGDIMSVEANGFMQSLTQNVAN